MELRRPLGLLLRLSDLLVLKVILLKECQDIKVFLLKMDIFSGEVLIDQFFLFPNWLAAPVNLLEHHLHHGGLALGEHLHFSNGFLVDLGTVVDLRRLETVDYPVSVLVPPFLKMPLNLLWIERLKLIWLNLESLVKILEVLYIILDGLGALLLDGRRSLKSKCLPTEGLSIESH